MSSEESPDTIVITIKGVKTTLMLNEKVFKSGKTGYFAGDKIKDANGIKFQVICNIVKIKGQSE